jgi:hypothetical protein
MITVISIKEYERIENKRKLAQHIANFEIKMYTIHFFIKRVIPFIFFVFFIFCILKNIYNTIIFIIN